MTMKNNNNSQQKTTNGQSPPFFKKRRRGGQTTTKQASTDKIWASTAVYTPFTKHNNSQVIKACTFAQYN
jgi:hypothetical protein